MKKVLGIVLVLLVGSTLSFADQSATWQGYQWDNQGWGAMSVSNGGLQLQLTSGINGSVSWGIAHTQISGFSSYATPWLQASFIDSTASGTGALLAFENPLGINPVWGEVGYDPGISTTQYGVYVANELTGDYELIVVGERSIGEHLLNIGRSSTGTLDFYFDNQLAFTSQIGHPDSLSDIYLFANGLSADAGGSVVFTSFSAGNGYKRGPDGTFDPETVPEPASLLLVASGLGGLAVQRLRLRK